MSAAPPDVRSLVCDLIRFDSVSSRTNRPVADFCRDRLEAAGFECESIDYDDRSGVGKRSIVARRGDATEAVAYFGHTDVVPADDWTGPGGPFDPVVDEGRLYGRGSCDMKGSVAAFLTAAASCDAPAYVVLTADEETGFGGARSVRERSAIYRQLLKDNVGGIIGEPTLGRVVHGHKGGVVWTFEAAGTQAHSSFGVDDSATLKLMTMLTPLRELIARIERENVDDRFDPPGPTPNVMLTDASPAINVTSASASVRVFLRTTPAMDLGRLTAEARGLAEANGIDFRSTPPSAAFFRDASDPYVRRLCERTGTSQPATVSYGTDACIFGDVANLAVCGPGSIEQAHTQDEWISLDELDNGVRLFSELLQTPIAAGEKTMAAAGR